MSKFLLIKKMSLTYAIAILMLAFCIVGMIALSVLFGCGNINEKSYAIKMIQFAILALCFFAPFLFEKMGFVLGGMLLANYYLFVFVSIFIGSIINIYDLFWPFDIIVHFYSGVLFGLLALTLVKDTPSGFLRFVFCIALATMVGVLWEFYEFSFDRLLGLNMQRTANVKTLEPFIGYHAISDTMLDLLCDFSGGTLAALFCFARSTKDKKFLITKK